MDINFDLENSPLQIETDSAVGSNEKVFVTFYSGSSSAGGVVLSFSSPPQYQLIECNSSPINFPTDLPSETDKVWTITKDSRVSDEIRVVIYCNDKEVLNVVLSDTCSDSRWSENWSKDVDKIHFDPSSDTASDFYRKGK